MLVIKKCQYCGKEFETRLILISYGFGRFCSKPCGYAHQRSLRVKKICPVCNKEFYVISSMAKKRKTCSLKCMGKRNSKKVKQTCKNCHKVFYVVPSEIKRGNGKFCSIKCFNKYYHSVKIVCQNCGKIFIKPQAIVKREEGKFCSRKCSNEFHTQKIKKICKYCGKEFRVKPSRAEIARFCSYRCWLLFSPKRNTSIERAISKELLKHKIGFYPQKQFFDFHVDFYIPPRLIIEADGDYWHSLEKVRKLLR